MKTTMKIITLIAVTLATFSTPSLAQWTTTSDVDEMSGESSHYTLSTATLSTKRMDFPYSGTKATIAIGCIGTTEWAYIHFTHEPNLNNTETFEGHNEIITRVKWNDVVKKTRFTQDWSSKYVHFSNDKSAINNIMESNTLLLELDWHGNGRTYFKFNLSGSTAAITKMRAKCNNS